MVTRTKLVVARTKLVVARTKLVVVTTKLVVEGAFVVEGTMVPRVGRRR
ncbi:hypothetical protein LPW11_08575 [Geomonas sp. RF6]|nr:hypothetical protein [Geomonas sp. RF6]UFS72234.1 hypothetical protein LPW11_08575 [Geomonas sp. RF6]